MPCSRVPCSRTVSPPSFFSSTSSYVPRSQISTVPAPYSPFGISPSKVGVVERVVLDVDGERALAGLERHALRHRPARERAVALEPEVVVEPPGVVALDDEDRLASPPRARATPNGSECARRIALAAILGQVALRHQALLP